MSSHFENIAFFEEFNVQFSSTNCGKYKSVRKNCCWVVKHMDTDGSPIGRLCFAVGRRGGSFGGGEGGGTLGGDGGVGGAGGMRGTLLSY